MKTFINAVAFAAPGIIAIGLVLWGLYLLAMPLFFGHRVDTLVLFGRQVTSLQAGLVAFVLGLVIALLSMVGSLSARSPRSPGSPGAE